jgi:hypothetical protein
MPDGQLYQLSFTATGEVRDAEGNLISSEPISSTVTVTAEQAAEILGHREGEPQ